MTGHAIAHYRITSKLGQGGMGAVDRAGDTKLDREVAFKVIKPGIDTKQDVARSEAERQDLAEPEAK
jgi:serine/threonine protein kinase